MNVEMVQTNANNLPPILNSNGVPYYTDERPYGRNQYTWEYVPAQRQHRCFNRNVYLTAIFLIVLS